MHLNSRMEVWINSRKAGSYIERLDGTLNPGYKGAIALYSPKNFLNLLGQPLGLTLSSPHQSIGM